MVAVVAVKTLAPAITMPTYTNNSTIYLIPVTVLGTVALGLVILRVYTRAARTRRLRLDDWFIIIGEGLSLLSTIFAYIAIAHGWGKPMAHVTPADLTMILKMQFATQLSWVFALCFTRLSIAASLLRFESTRWWTYLLYFMMSLQCLITTAYFVIQLGQCRPISASWETIPDVQCWPMKPIINFGWAVSAVYIIMDLTLSLMPIRLIRNLSRSPVEKVFIGFLMSLGLLATAILCAKMTTFLSFGTGDALQATILPSTYAMLENVVMIIACSLPCLKSTVERSLKKLGILKEHQLTQPSFVNAVNLSTVPDADVHQLSGTGCSSHSGKNILRVDSAAFKSDIAQSSSSSATGPDAV